MKGSCADCCAGARGEQGALGVRLAGEAGSNPTSIRAAAASLRRLRNWTSERAVPRLWADAAGLQRTPSRPSAASWRVSVLTRSARRGRSAKPGQRLLQTVCSRPDWAHGCRRSPIPDVGQFLGRPSAVPWNLTFGVGGANRRSNDSATRSSQRLHSLAANIRCRPIGDIRNPIRR